MYYMEIDSINIYSKQFLLVIVMDDKSKARLLVVSLKPMG